MELSDHWVAKVADEGERRTFADDGLDVGDWEPVSVPGHWRSTPAFAEVSGPVLYRREFDLDATGSDRRWWLTFDGIFYQGDIWLDGTYLGDTEGYFAPHTFEITEQARQRSQHVLAVEASCSDDADPDDKRNLTGTLQHGDHAGWNPGGIWRTVRIDDTGPVHIAKLTAVCTEADETRAVVTLSAELDSTMAVDADVHTTVGPVDHHQVLTVAAGANSVEWTVTVDRPRLWWPHALGDAHTELVTVEVRLGGDASDRRELRTGLRSVSMRNWILTVNGERMFVKAATQGPTRLDLAEATESQCRRDVELAVDAGLDMLRLHAHVARPETYRAADDAGLLLWQDFPLLGVHNRHTRKQAVKQATRMASMLAHHPSIAVWCAHDEPYPSDQRGIGLVARQQLPSWNRTVLDRAVRRAIRSVDASRPTVAHSGVPPHLPTLSGTDSHIAFGWNGSDERRFPAFARAMPSRVRFPTRFGARSVPPTDDFVDSATWPDLDWERLERAHGLHLEMLDRYVPRQGLDYDTWKAASQDYQGELIRRHIETLRRIKYRPGGGFAVGGFADPAPAISHSVLDHDRRPKRSYEALRAACAPVIVVADRLPQTLCPLEGVAVDVHVVSDVRVPLSGEVTARLTWTDDDGRVASHVWRFGGDVGADDCARVGTLQFEAPPIVGDVELTLAGHVGDHAVANRYTSTVHDH